MEECKNENKRIHAQTDTDGNINLLCGGAVIAWLDRKYLMLRNLRFRPEGEILVHIQHICWKLNYCSRYLWDYENVQIKLKETEGGELILCIEADSFGGELSNATELKVCYSDERQCIIYKVEQTLKVNREHRWITNIRTVNNTDYAELEYTDPWFFHITGPAAPVKGFWPGIGLFPGQECDVAAWRKRWQMFVYEREDGVLEGCRHNHSILFYTVKVKKDGFIGVFDDPAGNPVYRFTGDTAERTYIDQCHWGYDLHFYFLKECAGMINSGAGYIVVKPGEEYKAGYEIFAMTPEQSKPIMEKVAMQPLHKGKHGDVYKALDRPVYAAGVNRFDKSIEAEDMNSFAWVNRGKGAIWEKDFGYDDDFSLKLDNPDALECSWGMSVGSDMFMETLEAGKQYKLLGWFYTGSSTAKGFKILVRYGVVEHPDVKAVEHERVEDVNTGDVWKYFEFVTPPVPERTIWASIEFSLPGAGRIWVDNVEFRQNG